MAFFEAQGFSVGYDRPILKSIDFQAEKGQLIGILGRNGCGKTTLLRGLAGGARQFSGQILLAGHDWAALSVKQRAALLSFLPQQTHLPEGITARQVIAMGRYAHGGLFREPEGDGEVRISQAARRLAISDLLDRDCARLSQGQQQLVLLARQLVQDTPVMLLDEPSAALDLDNSATLFALLEELARQEGKLILLVLHDPDTALRWCHRLLLVGRGGLLADVEPGTAGVDRLQQAMEQLYPNVTLRRDPYDGALRCYMK